MLKRKTYFVGIYENFKPNKTVFQPQVFATEFLNNERPRTLFETFFFVKAYQNPNVKPSKIRSLHNKDQSP